MKGILQTLLGVVIALVFLAVTHDEPKPIQVTVKQEKPDYSEWEQFPRVEYVQQEDPRRVQARAILTARRNLIRQERERSDFAAQQELEQKERAFRREQEYLQTLLQIEQDSFNRQMQIELISRVRPDVHLHDPFNPYGHQCHSSCNH